MRKVLSLLLCAAFCCSLVSSSCAQTVSCPEARLILSVPDRWESVPLRREEDPDLRLLLRSEDLSLSVYVSDAGGFLPDAFQVFTGDETESGTVLLSGVEMDYVFGENAEGEYRIYTWPDLRNQVQLYFLISGRSGDSRAIIEEIMNSLTFESASQPN